jgi:hypothetical protein
MMQDDAGLVEVMARAILAAEYPLTKWEGTSDAFKLLYERQARAALAAIEAAGFKVVPVKTVDAAREFVAAIAEGQHPDGVPWERAEQLLKEIDAALSAAPKQG